MNIKEWLQEHPKGVTFKCDCGATVNLQIWVEDFRVCMYARCWKCNKEMERQETTILIDIAKFDIVDHMIDNFKKNFNKKEIPIRRIK